MRLEAIERPESWFVRAAYWYSRRRLGRVMTPLRVVYARWPQLLRATRPLLGLMEDAETLDPRLSALVTTWVSQLNGCSFCEDLHRAQAHTEGHGDGLAGLAEFRDADGYTPAEKAALAYAEEATLYKRVDDDTFEGLRAHFDDESIVRLTWLVAFTNYLNLIALPLGIGSDGYCTTALEAA